MNSEPMLGLDEPNLHAFGFDPNEGDTLPSVTVDNSVKRKRAVSESGDESGLDSEPESIVSDTYRISTQITTTVASISGHSAPNNMTRKRENPYLRVELRRMTLVGINLLRFVQILCPDIEDIKAAVAKQQQQLSESSTFALHFATYKRTVQEHRSEKKLYKPFKEMMNCAFQLVGAPLDYISTDRQAIRHEHREAFDSQRKPDGVIVPYNGTPRGSRRAKHLTWSQVIVPFEFKLRKKKGDDNPENDEILSESDNDDDEGDQTRVPAHSKGKPSTTYRQTLDVPRPKRRKTEFEPGIHSIDFAATASGESSASLSTLNHSRGSATSDSEYVRNMKHLPLYNSAQESIKTNMEPEFILNADGTPELPKKVNERGKRDKDAPELRLSDEEQLASYALEILSAGTLRRHAAGVYIQNGEFQLWYFDRAGAIGSCIGKFLDFPTYIALLVVFLTRASSAALGYEPLLVSCQSNVTSASQDHSIAPSKRGGKRKGKGKGKEKEKLPHDDLTQRGEGLYLSSVKGCSLDMGNGPKVTLEEWLSNSRGIVGEGSNTWRCSLSAEFNLTDPLLICDADCERHKHHTNSPSPTTNTIAAHSLSFPSLSAQNTVPPGPSSVPAVSDASVRAPGRGFQRGTHGSSTAAHMSSTGRSSMLHHDPSDSHAPSGSSMAQVGVESDPHSEASPRPDWESLARDGIATPSSEGLSFAEGPSLLPPSSESPTRTHLPEDGLFSSHDLFTSTDGAFASASRSHYRHRAPPISPPNSTSTPSTQATGARAASSSNESVVPLYQIKLLWQPVGRTPEDEFFRLAAANGLVRSISGNVGDWNAVPTVIARRCVTRLSHSGGFRAALNEAFISHPIHQQKGDQATREKMRDDREQQVMAQFEDRVLTLVVTTPIAVPLGTVRDPKVMLEAVISLVNVHRQIYAKSKILHRAISNLSLLVDSRNPSQGILSYFEWARVIGEDATSEPASAFRLVMAPFLATDLCAGPGDPKPPMPAYRHELESFFWDLLWTGSHWSHGKRVDIADLDREGISWRDVQSDKDAFIARPTKGVPTLAENLRPLLSCITALRTFFREATQDAESNVRKSQKKKGAKPLDKQAELERLLTYKRFREILVREWEKLEYTFHTFGPNSQRQLLS